MRNLTLSIILDILRSQGHEQYGGEAVSQLEHALQCAALAQEKHANPEMVTACLLHDLGHLIYSREEIVPSKLDDHHEYRAIPLLQHLFSASVIEPIRLHVQAKRYLCTVNPNYFNDLSTASQMSLAFQGGTFSSEEAESFIALPYARAAVQLRIFDEQAKVPGRITPTLDELLPILEHCN